MIKLKKIISALIREQIDIKDYFLSESNIAKILDGYLYAIIFMEEEKMIQDAGLEVPEDDYSRFSVDDFDSDTVIDQYQLIKKFLIYAGKDAILDFLTADYGEITDESLSALGHNIWLGRNEYDGAFDFDYYQNPKNKEKLISAAHKLGEAYAVLGSGNTIYIN